jgi:heptosyltransferase-2
VGFSTSAGRFLFTKIATYDPDKHEILRNLKLLGELDIHAPFERPMVYPSEADRTLVVQMLVDRFGLGWEEQTLIAVAPGSVWNTKRWPEEYFQELIRLLADRHLNIALVGGKEDAGLCERLSARHPRVMNAAGKLTVLQSADLIRRSDVLVSNDSAPMHLAVAMDTPVLAIFGATVPEFGFAPVGEQNRIQQTDGLPCRPCSIHGGKHCPIGTFECMLRITPAAVFQSVRDMLHEAGIAGSFS